MNFDFAFLWFLWSFDYFVPDPNLGSLDGNNHPLRRPRKCRDSNCFGLNCFPSIEEPKKIHVLCNTVCCCSGWLFIPIDMKCIHVFVHGATAGFFSGRLTCLTGLPCHLLVLSFLSFLLFVSPVYDHAGTSTAFTNTQPFLLVWNKLYINGLIQQARKQAAVAMHCRLQVAGLHRMLLTADDR